MLADLDMCSVWRLGDSSPHEMWNPTNTQGLKFRPNFPCSLICTLLWRVKTCDYKNWTRVAKCRTNVGERMFMSLWTSNLKSVHFVVSPRIGRSGVLPNLPVGQKNMWTTVRLHDSNLFFRYGRHNEESITSVKEVIGCTILSVISEPNATVQRSGTP